jgi:uncharacterized protein involved in exopolysaccharide biosynthesis
MEEPRPQNAQVSVLEILTTIVRGWRPVVILPIVLALVVGVVTFLGPRQYAATMTFMTQGTDNRAGGGAAMLAQQFGISLGMDRPGETPQYYVDMLRTRAVLRPAVETSYEFVDREGRSRRATLIELYETRDDPRYPPPWDQAVDRLRRSLSTSVTGTGLVHVTVRAPHPEVAEQVAERLITVLNDLNTSVRQGRAESEGRFVGDRVRDAEAELLAAEAGLQDFLTHNRLFEQSPQLVFEHERLQRQVAIRQDVFTSLLRAREQNRIDALRDTPLLTVIDHSAGTARPQPRGTITRAILAFMLGLVVAVLVAFIAEFVRRTRSTGDPQYRALEGAAREAWQDIRRPRLWVGRREGVAAGDN